jgi:hypothetical protein
MRRTILGLFALAGCAAVSGALLMPVEAHHAIQAEFDTKKTSEITGVLTRFAMVNPHVRWYFVENETKLEWEFTASGPGAMRDAGLARIFKPGDTYHVTFAPAFSGARVGRLRTMTFPDGRTVTMFHEDPTKSDVKVE